MTRFLIALVVLTQLALSLSGGQSRTGSISGRVTGDSGEPLPNVSVFVARFGPSSGPSVSTVTDESGRFRAPGLTPGAYSVEATFAGFVVNTDSSDLKYYRIGDTVNIQMTKGGVITGTVTNQLGEPVMAAWAAATLVRDSLGRPVRKARDESGWTDDRGIYRIYGLKSGSYLVAIKGSQFYYQGSSYDVPVYHPSSTRDGAKEVSVQNGQEVTGIDIRYRSERGHAVSGTFTGAIVSEPHAVLVNADSSTVWARSFNPLRENARSFAFYGVPDGDYQLIGQTNAEGEGASASAPRRVTMKGADITGIGLALSPLGSVTGRFTLDPVKRGEHGAECKDKQAPLLEETVAVLRRDQKNDKDHLTEILGPGRDGALSEKGDFAIYRVVAGRYYISARLPGEGWYIRAVTLPGTTRERPGLDIARDGMTITAGQRVTGLVVSVAEGAAAIRGKVISSSEGGSLPANLRVHLIPAERESADDTVRFAEGLVNNDGTFSLANLAPGRYYIMARAMADDEWMERTPRPIAWDLVARARLRQEMESTNAIVELRPCQRIADYALKFATSSRPKPPPSKGTGQNQ